MKMCAIIITAMTLCISATTTAQEVVMREQTGGNVVLFESYYAIQDSNNYIAIPFRIRYDFFVFTRKFNNGTETYSANGEVTVEMLDSTESSIARKIQQINLSTDENSPAFLRTQFTQNLFTFQLPSGKYKIVFKVEDKESKRQFVDNKKQISIPKATDILSSVVPIQKQNVDVFSLYNLGGDVLFSQHYGFVVVTKKKFASATYSLYKLQIDEDGKETVESNTAVEVTSFENKTVALSEKNQMIELTLADQLNSTVNYITLNGLQLRQGRYEIKFTFPDSTKVKTQFGALWLDMPVTLSDLDIATEPIQFITTKDDYSELRRGGRETRIKKFEEFWKKKDTTPATAYNEVMHEFYRRVDFAFTAFRTLREMNGAITDRGKIYILYGKPTSTERTLSPGGSPKEIWKYSSLNKTFTFEDPSKQGNYKLTENK